MTNEEKFQFDLQGYLVIKKVLSDDELAQLNAIADAEYRYDDLKKAEREYSVLPWGEAYKKLIDHPTVLPYLLDLVGGTVRLDHDYCIFMPQGQCRGGLHGGHGGDHWYEYRNGVMSNGLTVVTYFLNDSPEDAGGFACVPGSHKSNFNVGAIPEQVRSFSQPAHYVVQPVAEAGDVLIFTESLMHGTMPWQAKTERRCVLYKYSPGYSSWANNWYGNVCLGELTPQQQRLLAPPSVDDHPLVLDKSGQ